MTGRARLLPAVILGALGLFALKAIGWMQDGRPEPPASVAVSDPASAQISKGFARIIARAHAPDNLLDPETTGSVPDKKDKKDDKKDEKKEAQAREEEARRAADPRNKANVVNGSEKAMSPSERALLERLSERREEIEARSRELEMREKLLATVEKKVEGRVDELKQLEDKLDGGGAASPAAKEAAGMKSLVVMYETMKPKDAARVFDRLSIDILLPVVQAMNPRKMSDILAAMSPEAAEKLTVALAARATAGGARERAAAAPAAGLPPSELPAIAPAGAKPGTPARN